MFDVKLASNKIGVQNESVLAKNEQRIVTKLAKILIYFNANHATLQI